MFARLSFRLAPANDSAVVGAGWRCRRRRRRSPLSARDCPRRARQRPYARPSLGRPLGRLRELAQRASLWPLFRRSHLAVSGGASVLVH